MTVPVTADGPRRQRDPERTRQEILDVALTEFARNGYSGARVDEIAARTRTTKRMIYYYFTSKEQLYIAVLERAYSTARDAERQLAVDQLNPVSAIRTLAELTFDHHETHQDFIRLVAIENIHRGEYIARSAALAELNTPAVSVTASILERGYAVGAFRRQAEPVDVHMIISAFCFFRVANRYTFGAIFGTDLVDPARREHYRQMVGDLVVSYLTSLLGRRSTTMWRSTERILVSHAGALPRPANLQRLFDAYPQEQDSFAAALPGAVREVVGQQVAAGADVVNDGEISKRGLFIGYIRDRMAGFEEVRVTPGQQRAANAGVTGRDRRDFPGFYAAGLGGFGGRPAATAQQDAAHSVSGTAYVCAGPLRYTGHAAVRADIDNLRAACRGRDAEPFLPAITPGTVEHWLRNEHYPDDESFLEAIAGVLHEEYKAITDAGLLLQVDDPDLPDGWQMFPDMTVAQYREYAALRVEALNHALAGIPADQVRLHVCWGSQHGPHRDDIPLRDIIDLVLSVPAGCYSIEAANPRHEHEWALWQEVKLPAGASLMPGVVSHATDTIEHPELIAQRLIRYAEAVGAENVIAGTDCGLGGRVGHPEIAWAKLADLAEGARLASRRLWGQ